ncbi:MAG: radical SAM protein [Promethearchaeota archaeon]
MKKNRIVESKGKTFYIKNRGFPKGCKYCLKGTKAVLFLNGICQKPPHCFWYCPISEKRKGKDITFANEIQISSKEELIEEINKINAKGISITGGDPLFEPNYEKALDYIKYVKSVKGKKFHIHLYTNGINFNEKICEELSNAGLDELRFHPPKEKRENIKFAINKGISIGSEVPVIPNNDYIKDLEEFIFFLDEIGAEFINLNEFEFCFSNSQSLKDRGFKLKEGTIASVDKSKELALNLIKKLAPKVKLKMHFCSIISKDYYQLKNRYLRRAKSVKLPYESITEEGLLLYAQIEGNITNLITLNDILLTDLRISKKVISFNKKNIKIPYYIALNEHIISLLHKYKLIGYIIEIIPFRAPYFQITEKTPIKIFKKEIGLNEN